MEHLDPSSPRTRPGVDRVLRIGRDDQIAIGMHEWRQRNADYNDQLLQEEV
jgi:hypothetical protein